MTERSVSGCACSAQVDRCVPAPTTTWLITAHAWIGRLPPSRHSVSLMAEQENKHIPYIRSTPKVASNSDGACKRSTHCETLSASTAPPSGPCDIQCQNGGSCYLNARQVAKCRCQPSYKGERCEINQCRDYCKNGGTCTASHRGNSTTCYTFLRFLYNTWSQSSILFYVKGNT